MGEAAPKLPSPQEVIDAAPMSWGQLAAIAITVLLNALDGYDAASISFAAPGLAEEWGLERDALGWVLSMELIGMAAGSLLLGGLADRIGRRPTIIGCLILMTGGMLLAGLARSVLEISALRVLTGLGIGGMLAALTALVGEYANARRKNLVLSVMVVGYPIGAVLGGIIASNLLAVADWRAVFQFGAATTAAAIPLALAFMPESPAFLNARRPSGALERINRTLRRFRLTELQALPEKAAKAQKAPIVEIFQPGLARTTILITFAYFTHISCYYFIMKWIPKLVVDMGFDASSAANILVWAMLGGAIGGPIFGMLAERFTLKVTTIGALLGSFIAVNLFAQTGADLGKLALVAGLIGFFANSAGVGFYALLARAFPAPVRATGTGFGIGVGRAGAALGPAMAGELFAGGVGLSGVALLMACGSLIAACAVWQLRISRQEPILTAMA